MTDVPGTIFFIRARLDSPMLYLELLERIDGLAAAELRAVDDYLASRPTEARSEAVRALLALKCGQPEAAAAFAARAEAAQDPLVDYTLALYDAERSDFERSLIRLGRLPGTFAFAGEARALEAALLLTLERVDDARARTRDDPQLSDTTRGALFGLAAQCALRRGDAASAREHLEAALRFAPGIDWARASLAAVPPPTTTLRTVAL